MPSRYLNQLALIYEPLPDHQQSDRRAVVDAVFPSVAYPSHSGEPQLVQMRNKKYWIRYMVNKNVGGYK